MPQSSRISPAKKIPRLLLPKALQVLRHLAGEREVLGVKALNLLNARPGILGEVEDVDLAV